MKGCSSCRCSHLSSVFPMPPDCWHGPDLTSLHRGRWSSVAGEINRHWTIRTECCRLLTNHRAWSHFPLASHFTPHHNNETWRLHSAHNGCYMSTATVSPTYVTMVVTCPLSPRLCHNGSNMPPWDQNHRCRVGENHNRLVQLSKS